MLQDIACEVRGHLGNGKVASYIPELKKVPKTKFGMAVHTADGVEVSVGDAAEPFSIQSISKLLTLILALCRGGDEVWERVGKEPSGTPFNFLAQLELEKGVPRNPFINAGALVVTDYLRQKVGAVAPVVRDYARVLTGSDGIDVNTQVAMAEFAHAHKNLAIAHLLRTYRTIHSDPSTLVREYCNQCALEVSCSQLARLFLPLAAGGFSRILGETVMTERIVRRVNALLMTSGVYDSVGSFAYRVGLPAKSGVGGGIVAIAPGKCSIAVWSPGLDRSGNSLVGTLALELFAQRTKLSVLG
ncbi:glutaminase [Azospirillum canadense]|uniref:glutaminase n=1 Tax=Azospirillum canadense TaxID=403962 RepID=UPI002226E029|nr:glutaminase [Azospirillum canadense]MCW2240478.1 glutaminase [Azospirillum canadense]